jgi:glycosyltransferase involved in cell wall biosynthesis
MRIGLDAHAAEQDGSGNCTYIRGLIRALLALDRENEYILYINDKNHRFYRELAPMPRLKLRPLGPKNPLVRIPLSLARATYADRPDILHVQYIAPPWHRGKLVATIHDLGFLHVPETFPRFFVWRSKWLVRRTARKADKVIVGSEYSKDDLVVSYGVDANKVAVIRYGVSPRFGEPQSPEKTQQVLQKYRVQPPFILAVGRLNPRKNLLSLATAFGRLKAEERIPHQLVVAGKADYQAARTEAALGETGGRDIVLAGYVPDDDLPALYQAADVFVYPSLFEGGGLPILEAMAAGTPVIAARTSALPETVGDAGILVDPLNVDELARELLRLALDRNTRSDLKRKGLARSATFSWQAAAERTLETYREVFSEA